jgi:ATP-dependent Lhr-like helicase
MRARRVLEVKIAGRSGDCGGGCGAVSGCAGRAAAAGLPGAFLEAVPDALLDLVRRYARTHGPFTTPDVARGLRCRKRGGGGAAAAGGAGTRGGGRLSAGRDASRVVRCEVLRTIRRKSLAKLRKEVEPVEQRTLARLFTRWQGWCSRGAGWMRCWM